MLTAKMPALDPTMGIGQAIGTPPISHEKSRRISRAIADIALALYAPANCHHYARCDICYRRPNGATIPASLR